MKIAFCFSGQLRTGVLAAPNVLRYIGHLLPHVTFFCHTWDKNSNKLETHKLKHVGGFEYYHKINKSEIDEFKKIYKITEGNLRVEEWTEELLARTTLRSWIPLWYSFKQSVYLTYNCPYNFDIVIKYRPDILMPKSRSLASDILNTLSLNDFNLNRKLFVEGVHTPKMTDVYFMGSRDTMLKAAGIVDYMERNEPLPNLPFENEYLNSLDVSLHPIVPIIQHGFCIYRPEGIHIDPMDYRKCHFFEKENYHNIVK